MKLAIHFPNFTLPGGPEALAGALANTARAAEEAGCAQFTVMDHYFQMEQFRTAQDPMLEGYTALGFLAGVTERMRLGLLVTGVTYRHPGLLAKIVTTLDVLSGGRAQLGIGAAWYEREHLGLGVPTRRSANGTSASKRRCRSASRCGATTTAPLSASTSSWPRPSACPGRSSRAAPRS